MPGEIDQDTVRWEGDVEIQRENSTQVPQLTPEAAGASESGSENQVIGEVGEAIEGVETVSQVGVSSIDVKGAILAQRFYATGRRKEAVARVWLIPGGSGNVVINETPIVQYLHRRSLIQHALEPFIVTQTLGIFDVKATIKGGGLTGQAGALRHGITKALVAYDPSLRQILRKAGLLTRDPRVKERKKYGRKRARRGFQFRKR